MHRLLDRQLKRLAKMGNEIVGCQPLFDLVDQAYSEFDKTLSRIQLSLDLSSEELRQRNDDLRAVFQVFPDLFIWLDANGQIIDMHGGATGIFQGLKRKDFIGQRIWQSTLVDKPGPLRKMFEEGEVAAREFVRSDQEKKVWCEFRFAPSARGKTILAVRDITDLKKKSAELQLAEEKFRSIFENATEGISLINFDGRLIEVNPAFARMFGYESPEHIVAEVTDIRTQMYYDPADRDILLEGLEKNGFVDQLEFRWLHRDGSIVWVAINARIAKKGPKKWIEGVIRDITKRCEAEIALHEAKSNLEKRVEERTSQLIQVNEDLRRTHEELRLEKEKAESANRLKTEFLANMSHEIRTPMNGILGLSELILKSEITEKQRGNIEGIFSSGETLLKIINDILDISKIEAGRLTISADPTDLFGLLEEVINIVSVGGRSEVSIELETGQNLPRHIIVDQTRLQQILHNLVGNAVKFTNKGFVKLSAVVLDAYGNEGQSKIRFSVEDTGLGIPNEQKNRIFEPFHQADSSVSRQYRGTGLGLSISQKLVGLLGGEGLFLRSELGKGSTFSFILSVAVVNAEPKLKGLEKNLSPVNLENFKVLVAEDWELNRHLLEQILNAMEIYDITFAVNGSEAVDAVLHDDYSLIFMDLQMPVMGGIEATRAIRSKGITTPILALTAHAMQEDHDQCIKAGMDDYLSKPYKMEEIARAIRRFV